MADKLSEKDSEKLFLYEEKLDISKDRVQLAEVNIHKEHFTEEKTITIPIEKEVLVIEKRLVNEDKIETTRIPLKEEKIEIIKHPVVLEDISWHIEEVEDNKCVQETLKKEKLNIETEGFTTVVDKVIKLPDSL